MIRRTVLPCTAAVALIAAGMVAVSGPALAADTATINGGTSYQTMAGFGASEAFGEADAVMNAPAVAQQQALDLLYSPTAGAGLTILRNEISADSGITIEPTAPASPTATPTYSALGNDQGQLWFAQQIKADFGVSNVFADAWSAPATRRSPTRGTEWSPRAGRACPSATRATTPASRPAAPPSSASRAPGPAATPPPPASP
jgi:O-glycosyl hydrolase